jgi:hypothetical protein
LPRPNQLIIQAYNLYGKICTSLHRIRGEFAFAQVCTGTPAAQDLHTVSFPKLPTKTHTMLANIE